MSATMKEQYELYRRSYEERSMELLGSYFVNQESRYVEPFPIYGPVYYVGDAWVCVHLIDTGDGLLLIDTGNCDATAMLVHAIWSLGFNPRDVKWIILSHGHLDHIGGAVFFRNMFGSKLYMGAPDCEMFRSKPELALLQEGMNLANQVFPIDVEIHDRDRLQFGSLELDFRLVPGHTEGCVALFFEASGAEGVRRFGYYGGFGFNTLTGDFLEQAGDPLRKMRDTYVASIDSVIDERVDIFIGNHTENNRTLEKKNMMQTGRGGGNPFIDADEWRRYLGSKKQELRKWIREQDEKETGR